MSEPSNVERLTALRDRLERLLWTADEKAAPALAREYRAVLVELDKIKPREASTVDDLATRRRARLAEAAGSDEGVPLSLWKS